jgi:integrase/recombinase XerD
MDRVRINGQLEVHPEAKYYIEWRIGGRTGGRFRNEVAGDEAIDATRRNAVELRVIRDGLIAAPEPPPAASDKTPIDDAIKDYLRYVKLQRKKRTWLTPLR